MMAHYAFLNENNIVTEVIPGVDENITQIDLDGTEVGGSSESWETFYGNLKGQICKRTSYNARDGKKWNNSVFPPEPTEEDGFRKNYASEGYTYDSEKDAFISPKPYPSWILNEITCSWQAPVAIPEEEGQWVWNEETLSWQ